MVRHFIVLAALAAAGSMLACTALAADANELLENGDFETLSQNAATPAGWPQAKSGISYETENGNHFLRLRSESPGQNIIVYRAIAMKPQYKALELRFRVRFDNIKPGKQSWFDGRIMMNFKDSSGETLSPGPKHPSFHGSSKGQWLDRTVQMIVPEGAEKLEMLFALFGAASGTIDFDDVHMAVIPANALPPEPIAVILPPTVPAPPPERLPAELRVAGNQLQTIAGKSVWLQGLAIPSLEWSVKGENVLKSVAIGIDDWKANVIRLPVNLKMWFGREGGQKDGGSKYRQVVDDAINTASARGVYVVLDSHRYRAPTDDDVKFWKDAAARYKNHPAVLFELLNEPHDISWEIWRNGGEVTDKKTKPDVLAENTQNIRGFKSPGMQKLVETVRETGAKNIIIAGGLDWGYDLSGVLKGFALDDRGGNGIVYSSHVYPWKNDWQHKFLDAAEKHPIFIGETGAEPKPMPFIPPERHEDPLTWAPDMLGVIQKHKLHWTAWCFHPKSSPRVLLDWNYTPTPFWGDFVKKALAGQTFEVKKLR